MAEHNGYTVMDRCYTLLATVVIIVNSPAVHHQAVPNWTLDAIKNIETAQRDYEGIELKRFLWSLKISLIIMM
jgi:hypothetical protein